MSDQRHELFASLMRSHCNKLLNDQTDEGMRATLQELMQDDVMQRSTDLAVALATEVLGAGEADAGVTKESTGDDFLLIGTFYITARLPVVARSFPGGYLAWLTDAFQRADSLPGGPALAHWIFTMDPPNVGTHLTVTQKDKTKYIQYAWDFFNPREMQRLFDSDPRPAAV